MGSFETVYSPYFIYNGKTALLHVIVLRSDGFPSLSQRTSLDAVGHPVRTEAEVVKAA